MAGLSREGFAPKTYDEIKAGIESRLEAYSPGYDRSAESPDGQLTDIISFLIGECWAELGLVYDSYNPQVASGQALRNIGLITGILPGVAERSRGDITTAGTEGTLVPLGTLFADDDGNEYYTVIDSIVPTEVPFLASLPGPIPVPTGTVTTIVSSIDGLDSISQPTDGTTGTLAQTETFYRTTRNKTVLRNTVGVQENMQARLFELGIEQVTILHNDNAPGGSNLADGTPPQSIHVTIGEFSGVTDEDIGLTILATKGLGTSTYLSGAGTPVVVQDMHALDHTINFSKAVEVPVFITANISFLDPDEIAGAKENIEQSLADYINLQLAGEDVSISRLYGVITPWAKAQVNSIAIGRDFGSVANENLIITNVEYASSVTTNINITVV